MVKMEWQKAKDIKKRIEKIVQALGLNYIKTKQIICYRGRGSTSRARARIWSLPRIWQQALNLSPYYIIEVIDKNFDFLSKKEQDKVLIHELLHIPKNFSGTLLSHCRFSFKLNNQLKKLAKIYYGQKEQKR